MIENDLDQWLTGKDVSAMLKLSRSSIWRYVSQGKLPKPVTIGKKTNRWKKSAIKAWMDAS